MKTYHQIKCMSITITQSTEVVGLSGRLLKTDKELLARSKPGESFAFFKLPVHLLTHITIQ